MNKLKRWLKSRTINFSALLAIAGAIQANAAGIRDHIPAEAYGWGLMAVGVVVAALRSVTTKPLAEK